MSSIQKFLKMLMQLKIGKRTEVVLGHMLSPWFSEYWLFANPKYLGQEIADAILIWGDVAFIIQVKTREGIHSDVTWGKRKIKIEKERINKWVGRLKTESILLRNKFRAIPFPKEKIKYYYGLIVLNHYSEPYEITDIPPIDKETAIQSISLLDLSHLLMYINTAWDFVVYFESRSRLSQVVPVRMHKENEVYFQNLENMCREMAADVSEAEAKKCYDFYSLAFSAANKELKKDDPWLSQYAASFLIDAAIGGQLVRAPKDAKGNFVADGRFELLTKAIEVLTELGRLRRAFYGRLFIEVAEKARASCGDEYKTGQSPKRKILYGFMATEKEGKELEDFMGTVAIKTLIENYLFEGIFISASAKNIIGVYEMIESWLAEDAKEQSETDLMESLRATILYINLKK